MAARLTREGTLKREVEYAHQKWSQAKEEESMVLGQIDRLIEEIQRKRSSGCINLQDTYDQILENLHATLFQVQHTLSLQQKMVKEQQERLKEAIIARKVVEKIKEKQYADWRLRETRSDGALLDDIALKKFADPK